MIKVSSVELPSLLIGTQNSGKVVEIKRILGKIPAKLISLNDLPEIPPPVEDGATFLDNAVIKARYYFEQSGIMAMADDSGLEVDALSGAPGVRSARYGGDGLNDSDRTALVLEQMRDVADNDRHARFRCVIAVAGLGVPNGCISAEGVVDGMIARQPRGDNGFGYDPIFIPDGEVRTTAEMNESEKDALSHRGIALRSLKLDLLQILSGSDINY